MNRRFNYKLVIENTDGTIEEYEGPRWFVTALFYLTMWIEWFRGARWSKVGSDADVPR